ncbi:Zinc finger transcription factor 37 [Hyphodiscus hymeniophilus]|uniref:Zinc finger transcription factor 37 n=1 Tax=Hyphodiscus hymeniophilus TaxID=353542 RepID=A0A9P7AZN6_9HELO|nr:Zinc finger transcription factor 37 [Hyphodiscus hymeniophilus]
MDSLSEGSTSSRPSPHHQGEESISMFVDFSSTRQEPHQTTFQSAAMSQETSDSNPRVGGIRVSLACVPCRSRHVKCGAEMPSCSRCQQDEKPCFYAKSRRGMRDRSSQRNRVSMREKARPSPVSGGHYGLAQNPMTYPVGAFSADSSTRPSSDVSASPASTSSMLSVKSPSPTRLLDLYYSFFHKAHPFVVPRYCLLARLDSDPGSLKYLLPVMNYIGSLYAQDFSTSKFRDIAYNQLEVPGMPPNGFTVQALLLAAIVMQAEDEIERARMVLDRAIYMALEIRMNSRTFANMERDPVLAESWRRTYWGLYAIDAMFAGSRRAPSFILYTIEANVELPCEEADYDGIIPRPRTLSDYEARDFEDEEPVFSSFAYLIDLIRISGTILGIERLDGEDLEAAAANADARLVNWKLHLPREKQGVIDRNEEADEILFQAHNLLQILFIFIHRPLSRLYHSPIEKISRCAPPPIPHEPTGNEDRTYWLHTKKALEAAETAISLYALPIPILQHTPIGICGIALSVLANISACSYVLSGAEWYRTRERIRLGLGGLKKFGEVWAIGRRTERETKKIARSVFQLPRPGMEMSGSFDFEMLGDESLTGFEDFSGMGYLNLLDVGLQGQTMNLRL